MLSPFFSLSLSLDYTVRVFRVLISRHPDARFEVRDYHAIPLDIIYKFVTLQAELLSVSPPYAISGF
jgi:hypothetical protein